MFEDPIYHLLCIDCETAIVADSIAKRERVPRRARCPVCGERRGDAWRPIEGTREALEEAVGDYETVEVDLGERSGLTVLEEGR